MRRVLLYLMLLLSYIPVSKGQYSPADTLFTINDSAYSSQHFLELYNNQQLLDENNYPLTKESGLDLYIDYQLKALVAKNLQLDTLPAVKKEIEKATEFVLDPYLYPIRISKKMKAEAFGRIKYFLRARHILIKIEGRESPKDTLEAYNTALEVRKELLEGRKFEKLARIYSDDLSVKSNDGDIGYFTAFDMEYPFENTAYSLAIEELSKPVRTQFGYHIIQVLETLPNPGKVKIRHLMIDNSRQNARSIADSIYNRIQQGEELKSFIKKYSDDLTSKTDHGILPWFGLFETHTKIEKTAFSLSSTKKISKPIKTEFGFHILELIDKKDYSDFDTCKEELLGLIKNDNRSKLSDIQLISKIKQDYNFTEKKELLSNFYSILDYAYADLWEPLFTIETEKYTQEEFANFLIQQPSKDIYENFKEYINRMYVNFSNNSILAFYKKRLLSSNKKVKYQLEEYKDGILVYFITKQYVWEPASNTELLNTYFKENRGKYNTNVTFEELKPKVQEDFRTEIEQEWLNDLKEKYQVKINKSTFDKIANK